MDDIFHKNTFPEKLIPSQNEIEYLVDLFSKGQLENTLNDLTKLLVKYPRSVNLYNLQGACFVGLNLYDIAIKSYKKAIEIKPKFAEAYNNMGVAQENNNDILSALESYKFATKLNPQYAEAFNNIGKCLIKQNYYKKSITYFDKAINIKPDYFEVYNNLGLALQNSGDTDGAINIYKKALKINQNLYDVLNNMGVAQKKKGNIKKAKIDFQKAISINTYFAEAYRNLGHCHYLENNVNKAIYNYKKAIEIKPFFAEAYNDIGNCFKNQNKLNRALDHYTQALKINPNYIEAHNNIGVAYLSIGEVNNALLRFDKALKIKKDYPELYNNKGLSLMNLGKLDDAVYNYKIALKIKPDYVEANFNLATVLYKSGNFTEAIDLFKKDNSIKSQNTLLQCLFLQNKNNLFQKQLNTLKKKGVINSVIGSYISRSNIRFGTKIVNNFCNNPLKYVIKTDISQAYDFKNTFIKGANTLLNNKEIKNIDQKLLTNGTQTAGNIFNQENPVLYKMKKVIQKEVNKYYSKFKKCDEGIFKYWPKNYEIFGWLIKMKSGGELKAHIHEQGWISGSIYINVPPKSKKDSGNLIVALDDEPNTIISNNNLQNIDVVTGSLCLFPSSLLHHTKTFQSIQPRVVLAFDIIPK